MPVGDCYFRKTFQVNIAEIAQVHVACDNQYELYVNGRLAGRGNDWRKMDVHDISKLLVRGTNVVAIKATNSDEGAAGLVARVVVKEKGGTFESYSSDATWRTSVKPQADWMQAKVRDSDWLPAKVYGPLGGVLPWGDEIVIADEGSRFVTDPDFVVDRLVTDEQAGSLIAMTFNANGDILASREGGGLLLIRDKNKDGTFETVETFSSEVKNIQGILSLGNRVLRGGRRTGGRRVYQITDVDGDGRGDKIAALIKFRGVIGEHGPHKVRLGPDGLLYLLCRKFSQAAATIGSAQSVSHDLRRRSGATAVRGSARTCGRSAGTGRHDSAHGYQWQLCGDGGGRVPQSVRLCVHERRRNVHVGCRHGMGYRGTVVSADAADPCAGWAANSAGGAAGRSGPRITSIACRRRPRRGPGRRRAWRTTITPRIQHGCRTRCSSLIGRWGRSTR